MEVLKFFGESASLAILAVVDGEERSDGSRLLFSVPRRRLVLCSAVVFGCSEHDDPCDMVFDANQSSMPAPLGLAGNSDPFPREFSAIQELAPAFPRPSLPQVNQQLRQPILDAVGTLDRDMSRLAALDERQTVRCCGLYRRPAWRRVPTALTLPNVDTILAEAQEVAERISEPATITRAYYLAQIAAQMARAGRVGDGLASVGSNHAERTDPNGRQPPPRGLHGNDASIARDGRAGAAVRAASEAGGHYAPHRDMAVGAIAVVQSQHHEAAGARATLARMRDSRRPYDYALDVATNLDDRAWGRELMRSRLDELEKFMADESQTLAVSREQARGLFLEISLLAWAGYPEQAEELVRRLEAENGPAADFAELRKHIAEPKSLGCSGEPPPPRRTPAEIQARLDAVQTLGDNQQKFDGLLAVAAMILDWRAIAPAAKSATATGSSKAGQEPCTQSPGSGTTAAGSPATKSPAAARFCSRSRRAVTSPGTDRLAPYGTACGTAADDRRNAAQYLRRLTSPRCCPADRPLAAWRRTPDRMRPWRGRSR